MRYAILAHLLLALVGCSSTRPSTRPDKQVQDTASPDSDTHTPPLHTAAPTADTASGPSCPRQPCASTVATAMEAADDYLNLGQDVAVHGDILIAGAPAYSNGWSTILVTPRAYVYRLPALDPVGSWLAEGNVYDELGVSVDIADHNGNGVPEFAVGAQNYDGKGAVYVRVGLPQGMDQPVAQGASLIVHSKEQHLALQRVRLAGNRLFASGNGAISVGGDDVVGGLFEFAWPAFFPKQTDDAIAALRCDSAFSAWNFVAWDVDQDGDDDFIYDTPDGLAVALTPWDTSQTLFVPDILLASSTSIMDNLGHSIEVIGDIDKDGHEDLAVGSGTFSTTEARVGRVDIILSSVGFPSALADIPLHIEGTSAGENVGYDFASGDFNGDGVVDLAVGAPGLNPGHHRGKVLIFQGPLPLSGTLHPTDAASVIHGDNRGDGFGFSLASHDADNDGKDDLVVSAPGHGDNFGAVYNISGAHLLP